MGAPSGDDTRMCAGRPVIAEQGHHPVVIANDLRSETSSLGRFKMLADQVRRRRNGRRHNVSSSRAIAVAGTTAAVPNEAIVFKKSRLLTSSMEDSFFRASLGDVDAVTGAFNVGTTRSTARW